MKAARRTACQVQYEANSERLSSHKQERWQRLVQRANAEMFQGGGGPGLAVADWAATPPLMAAALDGASPAASLPTSPDSIVSHDEPHLHSPPRSAAAASVRDRRKKRRASLRWTHAQRRGLGWNLNVARGTGDMYCALFADELPDEVRARLDLRRLESAPPGVSDGDGGYDTLSA